MIVFKNATDLYWLLNIPEKCSFAGETLSIAGNLVDYTKRKDGAIIVPVDDCSKVLRVCLLPLAGGEYEINGALYFTEEGEQFSIPMKPIYFEAEGLPITVPSKTNSITNNASGKISGTGKVTIYDNGIEVAQTETDNTGEWNVNFELVNPYTYSSHRIWATIDGIYGIMESERTILQYQYIENPIRVKSVTMKNLGFGSIIIPMINSHLGENIYTFEKSLTSYLFTPEYSTISFEIAFEGENLATITTVNTILSLSNGTTVILPAEKQSDDMWTCSREFALNALPNEAKVVFSADEELVISSEKMEEREQLASSLQEEPEDITEPISYITYTRVECDTAIFESPDCPSDIRAGYDELKALQDEVARATESANRAIDDCNSLLTQYNNCSEQLQTSASNLINYVTDGETKIISPGLPGSYLEIVSNTPVDFSVYSAGTQIPTTSGSPVYSVSNEGLTTLYFPDSSAIARFPDAASVLSANGNSIPVPEIRQSTAKIRGYENEISLGINVFGYIADKIEDSYKKAYDQAANVRKLQAQLADRTAENVLEISASIGKIKADASLSFVEKKRLLDIYESFDSFLDGSMDAATNDYKAAQESAAKASSKQKWAKGVSNAFNALSMLSDIDGALEIQRNLNNINEWLKMNPDDPELLAALSELHWYMTAKALRNLKEIS